MALRRRCEILCRPREFLFSQLSMFPLPIIQKFAERIGAKLCSSRLSKPR